MMIIIIIIMRNTVTHFSTQISLELKVNDVEKDSIAPKDVADYLITQWTYPEIWLWSLIFGLNSKTGLRSGSHFPVIDLLTYISWAHGVPRLNMGLMDKTGPDSDGPN